MTPIRLAVVGCGHLGRIHARIAASLPQFDLAAVVDPVADSRQQVAAQYGTEPLAEIGQLAGRVDAAVVATPTRYHHAVAAELLRAGVHLLVEKPLTPTHAEAEQLVALARQCGRVLQVGHVERFNPAWLAVQPHVDGPKFIDAVRRGSFTFRSTDVGVVHDLMIHDLDLVLSVVRAPVCRVDALGIALFGKPEDLAHARIEFENGCVATLAASRASHTAARAMHLFCRGGYAGVDFAARTAWVVRPSPALLARQFDADALTLEQRATLKDRVMAEHLPLETLPVEPADAITGELVDFAESILTARPPRVTGQHAAEALDVAEQILAAIDRHAWEGHRDGATGAAAASLIPAPHWLHAPAAPRAPYREAG